MTDQEKFDKEVNEKGALILRILAGIGIFASISMSIVALGQNSNSSIVYRNIAIAKSPSISLSTKDISTTVLPGSKRGFDGQLHDAYTVTTFNAKVDQPISIKVNNTDSAAHSITAPDLGINIIVKPGIHTYSVIIRKKGHFVWYCDLPCDNWAMEHAGYMQGYFNIT